MRIVAAFVTVDLHTDFLRNVQSCVNV